MKKTVYGVVAFVCILVVWSGPASAQRSGLAVEVPTVRNLAGLAVGVVPDYYGSDDYTIGIAPTLKYHWSDSERFVRVIANELSVNVLDSERWSFGPMFAYEFGRDDPDDDVVKNMAEISGTPEGGFFLGWEKVNAVNPRYRIQLGASFLHDIGGEHEGYKINVNGRYWMQISRALDFSVGISSTYVSDDYSETFFGVNAADSAASGLPLFDADAGVRDVTFSPMLVMHFSENWHVGAGVVIGKLLGDAADSPVVDRRGSDIRIVAGIGLVYAW